MIKFSEITAPYTTEYHIEFDEDEKHLIVPKFYSSSIPAYLSKTYSVELIKFCYTNKNKITLHELYDKGKLIIYDPDLVVIFKLKFCS